MSRQRAEELAQMRARWLARPEGPPQREDGFPRTPTGPGAERSLGRDGISLWVRGVVDWGWVFLAPDEAWAPGPRLVAGRLLYTDDPVLRRDPAQLHEVAARIRSFREAAQAPAQLQAAWRWSADPGGPEVIGRVPRDLCSGRVVWSGGVFLHRNLLVGGYLRDPLVPIVRAPAGERWGLNLLPVRFWADTLAARWSSPA